VAKAPSDRPVGDTEPSSERSVSRARHPRRAQAPRSPAIADNDTGPGEAPELSSPAHGHALPVPGVAALPSADRGEAVRIVEALLFAASEPLDEAFLARHLPSGSDVGGLLAELQGFYAGRGVNLVRVAGKWAFRTSGDLSYLLERHAVEERKLSRAALETLAIVAYHQPVTRAEIEEIRGVETSKGTMDILLETGWVRPRGRRRAPGKPITFGTTPAFLDHFGLEAVKDLPLGSRYRRRRTWRLSCRTSCRWKRPRSRHRSISISSPTRMRTLPRNLGRASLITASPVPEG